MSRRQRRGPDKRRRPAPTFRDQLEVGRYNQLPHYAVIGAPQEFYLWVNEDGHGGNSPWQTGPEAFALFHRLRALQAKDKAAFATEVRRLYVGLSKSGRGLLKQAHVLA